MKYERVLRLMDNQPVYTNRSLQDKLSVIIPPIMLKQHVLDEDGFVSWAWLSDEAQARFISGIGGIKPDDWNTGENLWFMDMIGNAPRLMRKVCDGPFKHYRGTGRWKRTFGTGGVVKIGMASR